MLYLYLLLLQRLLVTYSLSFYLGLIQNHQKCESGNV